MIGILEQSQASVPTPAVGKQNYFVDSLDGKFKKKDSAAVVTVIEDEAAGVDSFNARVGVVVPTSGDYAASQITNIPFGNVASLTVQAAINELDSEKLTVAHSGTGGASHALATGLSAGFMSAADFTKLAAFPANSQPLDSTLTALAAYNTNGILVQTAADTFAGRTITAGSGISVANGDGVSGNPTVTLDINGLTTLSGDLQTTDVIAVYDASAVDNRKVALKSIVARRARFVDQAFAVSEDFIGNITCGLSPEVSSGAGAGSQFGTYGINTTENALGVVQIDTGSTISGRCTLASGLNQVSFGTSRVRVGIRAAIEQLSTVTQTFTSYIGFIDNSAAGDHTNGAYFRYTDGVNGGRWEAVTAQGATRTATDTGVSANLLYKIFEIECNEAGTSVAFYIDGALVATNVTNIPQVTASQLFGFGVKINKSVGGTQMNMDMDWYYFELERSAAR